MRNPTLGLLILMVFGSVVFAQEKYPIRAYRQDELASFNPNIPIKLALDILNSYARKFENRLIIDRTERTKPIGVSVENMYWKRALEYILRSNQLKYVEHARYYEIVELAEKKPEKPKVEGIGIETREVEINAVFFQVEYETIRELGVDWSSLINGKVRIETNGANEVANNFLKIKTNGLITGRVDVDALLNAFESRGKGEIIARPHIRVVDGEQGKIQVDLDHQVTVAFKITGGPGGGLFLAPDSALTDFAGQAVTIVNSGTIAGALQIVAQVVGTSIRSAPVPLAVHGWLPDVNHFSVVPNKLNFPGYNIFGITDNITAFVGDKYSNPVPPATAVQFRSTGGIIEGSGTTDGLGRANSQLLAAAPVPQGVPLDSLKRISAASLLSFLPYAVEPGYALVRAQTVDENKQNIYAETIVLFSGVTRIINVNPATFRLSPGGSQLFTFNVSDQNKNPLVAGTTVQVATNNGDVAGGDYPPLLDTLSRQATFFSFVLTNSKPDSNLVKDATVTIKVTSGNGNASLSITGQMLPIK